MMLFLQIIRIIFGSIYVLFLPGFLFTFVFFERKEIDHLERIVLSLALSLATVPLLVFLFNLIKVPINALNVFLEILLLIILAADVLLLKRSKRLMGFFKKIRSKLP